MAWFLWCVLGGALGDCAASGRVRSIGFRVGALLAWVVLLALLVVGSLFGAVWAGREAVSAVALGFLAAVALGLVLMAFRGVGNVGRRSGLLDWARENRGPAAAVAVALVVVAFSVAMVGTVRAADHTIRSVPYESVPASAAPVVKSSPRVESSLRDESCRCGTALVCVGPKGGRYCINGAGKKRYL